MAKIDESQLGDDFSYIIRIADSDIDGLKQVKQGLTSIRGIGERSAEQICKIAGVDPGMLSGHLSDDDQNKLRSAIDEFATKVPWWMVNRQRDLMTNEDAHLVSMDIMITKDEDVARLAATKSYRGIRHRSGHKLRGQRLRSNGRRGATLGVERKK